MVKKIFVEALSLRPMPRPPLWMMRQAGRYQASYQKVKSNYSFNEICKNPDLAARVAINAIEEFDFDAAILFSDILYPIEAMGPKLDFDPGPKFSFLLREEKDLAKFKVVNDIEDKLSFQYEALVKTRKGLEDNKALLGFIGGPLTLYLFATEGTSKVQNNAKLGIKDGRFVGFLEKIIPILEQQLVMQAKAGPDAIVIFDSQIDFISLEQYEKLYYPFLKTLLNNFTAKYNIPIIYYKPAYEEVIDLVSPFVKCIGFDEKVSFEKILGRKDRKFAVQGNFDQNLLTLQPFEARKEIDRYFDKLLFLARENRVGWINNLGHGVLPNSLEENVKYFVQKNKELGES